MGGHYPIYIAQSFAPPHQNFLMSRSKSSSRFLLLAALGAAALIAGLLVANGLHKPRAVTLSSGTLLQQPRTLPEFQLVDENGAPFTRAQLQGQWTLIFPGFTYCPDICPTTLGMLKTVESQLGETAAGRLQIVLFSIDPERDEPARLKEYVHFFSPSFRAATAQEPELRKMAQALGVAYAKVPGATPESYTMDHSAALVLINPDGALAGYFTSPLTVPALVTDLRSLLESQS